MLSVVWFVVCEAQIVRSTVPGCTHCLPAENFILRALCFSESSFLHRLSPEHSYGYIRVLREGVSEKAVCRRLCNVWKQMILWSSMSVGGSVCRGSMPSAVSRCVGDKHRTSRSNFSGLCFRGWPRSLAMPRVRVLASVGPAVGAWVSGLSRKTRCQVNRRLA